jgi:hypothetical protein
MNYRIAIPGYTTDKLKKKEAAKGAPQPKNGHAEHHKAVSDLIEKSAWSQVRNTRMRPSYYKTMRS